MLSAPSITISDYQLSILNKTVNKRKVSKSTIQRATILLMFFTGTSKHAIARFLSIGVKTVRKWIERWLNASHELNNFEKQIENSPDQTKSKREYTQKILDFFEDNARCGAPPKFSAEQLSQIIVIACEALDESDEGISHRSQLEIAKEAKKRNIVESISQKTISRFLKSGRNKAA